jgi:NAD(P)-dependent dehydrogenase (short-subunit alcohol dehydrogenase family)
MLARALALNGAHKVYIVGRRKETLEQAASTVTTKNIIPIVGDVTSKDSLQSIVKQIEQDTGYVNVLIANSGIGGPQHKITPQTSLADFQKQNWDVDYNEFLDTFAVNTTAAWYTIIAFLDLLDKGNKKGNVQQKSQVIATSSIAGFNRTAPGGFAYGQSKAGTTLMMKQLATALVPYGIRSNVLCPGCKSPRYSTLSNGLHSSKVILTGTVYPSEMAAPILAKVNNEVSKNWIPAERIGTEEDMAGAILYLASMAGGYCNGNVLLTDGGRLSLMPGTY